jgi:hypothetical protein
LEDANIPLPDIEHRTNNFLRDIVITTDEIVDIIKILNPNKASGPDGNDLSPFLNIAITCAIFQLVGYLHCKRDLLNII